MVFTASHRAYADVVLDFVDPRGEIIDFRLYRESCVVTSEGMYIKDLRIFENRDLKDVVIVDNAVYSFGFQLDNGVPIIPYYDNPHDEELLHLSYYLKCLANCEDVREQNRQAFQLRELDSLQIQDLLVDIDLNSSSFKKDALEGAAEEEEEEEEEKRVLEDVREEEEEEVEEEGRDFKRMQKIPKMDKDSKINREMFLAEVSRITEEEEEEDVSTSRRNDEEEEMEVEAREGSSVS